MLERSKYLIKFEDDWNVEEAIEKVKNHSNGPFYLCNLSDVVRKFDDWQTKMPRVKPFYAVKCNDDIDVLRTLASVGCSFDCASAGEIEKILALNVNPNRIIFANTTKPIQHIEYAAEKHVNLMTFDNEDELHKITKAHPKADSQKAKYKLGKKFGCDPETEAFVLLKLAKKLNLSVVGISFHIGSSCDDYDTYCQAIQVSRQIFELAGSLGFHFNILDLGGGYPGDSFERIDEYSHKINKSLEENFPIESFRELRIFAEPGRYFVESAFTLVAEIHSRKVMRTSDGNIQEVMYYINAGVYSDFLFVPLGPEIAEPQILEKKRSSEKFKTTIWGPTCDSIDVVCTDIKMELMKIGDVMYFANMGAYTLALRTPFNGLQSTKVLHFIRFNDCYRLDYALFP